MVSNNSEITDSQERELQEMLEFGVCLGSRPRYLLYYYGQFAITNDAGLMHWPEGPKVIVAVVTARECAGGLSPARKEFLLARLRSVEGLRKRQCRQAKEDRIKLRARVRSTCCYSERGSRFCHSEA